MLTFAKVSRIGHSGFFFLVVGSPAKHTRLGELGMLISHLVRTSTSDHYGP